MKDHNTATEEKSKIEDKQREEASQRAAKGVEWHPRLFRRVQGGPGGSEEGEEDLNWVISAKVYVMSMKFTPDNNWYFHLADNPSGTEKPPTIRSSRFLTLHLSYLVKKQIIDLRFPNHGGRALQSHHLRTPPRHMRRMEFNHNRNSQVTNQTNLLILARTMSLQIKHTRKVKFTTITNIQVKLHHLYKCLPRNISMICSVGIQSIT